MTMREEKSPLSSSEEKALTLARRAQANAHAPYSGKRVGAAVITPSGAIFAGCNVENGSEALRVCAERNAIAAAVAAGEGQLATIIVVSPDDRFWPPCDSCRSVIFEFAPEAQAILFTWGGRSHRASFAQLPAKPFEADGTGEAG